MSVQPRYTSSQSCSSSVLFGHLVLQGVNRKIYRCALVFFFFLNQAVLLNFIVEYLIPKEHVLKKKSIW
jgi:hypothetical protein